MKTDYETHKRTELTVLPRENDEEQCQVNGRMSTLAQRELVRRLENFALDATDDSLRNLAPVAKILATIAGADKNIRDNENFNFKAEDRAKQQAQKQGSELPEGSIILTPQDIEDARASLFVKLTDAVAPLPEALDD